MKQDIRILDIKNKKVEIIKITLDEKEDYELLKKIRRFAETSAPLTYTRSGMSAENHIKNIEIGKRAEEAFSFFARSLGGNLSQVNYRVDSTDEYDFILENKYKVDIKSSTMQTKKRNYSIPEAIESFNFMVLEDQKHQDIIIQALYPSRDEYNKYYFAFYEFVNYVQKNGRKKQIKMNGNYGHYSLYPLIKGKPIKDIFKINNNGKHQIL